MKNSMSLKGIVKNIAKEKKISAQLVLQNYMMERFLERISVSNYQTNFIIKGGFLIASLVGLNSRATMDIDATIKNYPVSEESIQKMVEEICQIELPDDITFTFNGIGEIREGDEYTGYRVSLSANFTPMSVPLKLDITTGDKITPREIEYEYRLLMEDRTICVLAYNLATILAEKLETIISRGEQNTRSRDYYDVYILSKLRQESIDLETLKYALETTTKKRGTAEIIKQYKNVISVVLKSDVMNNQWDDYRKDFDYATEVSFNEVCDAVVVLMDKMEATR